eukprot:scaffold2822_cov100-Isochrysis_galbana.AAC.1
MKSEEVHQVWPVAQCSRLTASMRCGMSSTGNVLSVMRVAWSEHERTRGGFNSLTVCRPLCAALMLPAGRHGAIENLIRTCRPRRTPCCRPRPSPFPAPSAPLNSPART